MSTIYSITGDKRLDPALRESEALYRLLFETNPFPMWVLDAESLAFLTLNSAAVRHYGYAREEFLTKPVLDTLPAENSADFQSRPTDAGPVARGIRAHCRKDGTLILVEITSSPISFGGRRALLVQAVEVTKRLREETRREHHALQLKGLAQASIAIHSAMRTEDVVAATVENTRYLLGAARVELHLGATAERDGETSGESGGGDREPEVLTAPLTAADGDSIGVLVAHATGERHFDDTDESLLVELSRMASVAICNVSIVNQLQELSRRLVRAQESERQRIARDLHDQIGQMLTGLKFIIERVATLRRFEPTELAEIRVLIDQLMSLVHDLMLDLRPAALDRLGLLPALLGDLERFTARTGIQVDLEHAGLKRRFPPEIETAAFRIVQEALTNVARHAGVARATVRIHAGEDALSLQVADDGAGFDPEQARHRTSAGLVGMQERVTAIGGRLTVNSSPGAGTRILVELPLSATENGSSSSGSERPLP